MDKTLLPVRCPECDRRWDYGWPTDTNVIFNEIHKPCPEHR